MSDGNGGPGGAPRAAGDPLRLPAERWQHLRTTNPIESSFATVKQPGTSIKPLVGGPSRNDARNGSAARLMKAAWLHLDQHGASDSGFALSGGPLEGGRRGMSTTHSGFMQVVEFTGQIQNVHRGQDALGSS